jgi:hypothetical protein
MQRKMSNRNAGIPERLAQLPGLLCVLAALGLAPHPGAAAGEARGVVDVPCPRGSIEVAPGNSIQSASDAAGDNASICLKNGTHRMQAVRPRQGQSFHGEGRTILNGSRLLATFGREDKYWVANVQMRRHRRHGECASAYPTCNMPEGFFIDDKPLTQVLSRNSVEAGRFYIDPVSDKIYFADDPTQRKVEVTAAIFAFASNARNVLIRNIIVEKYANAAQSGAIHAMTAAGWTIENVEARWNSGAGIALGSGGRVRSSNVHHNGQIGIVGVGRVIEIDGNSISDNNTRGFDFKWEAGGVKIGLSDGVTMRNNHAYDNVGPGLWCDIECRNVLYERNVVERNHDAGIFHEISYSAIIRDNVVRHNGVGERSWFWGAEILVAASQDVQVYRNAVTVSPEGCGIVLIDQSRAMESGKKYKTRSNTVRENDMTFEGGACAGGASDAQPGDENYAIITDGNNRFDANVYRVPKTSTAQNRFVFGHVVLDWDGWHKIGLELSGRLVTY